MRESRLIEPGPYGTRPCTKSTYRRGGLTRAESMDPEWGFEREHIRLRNDIRPWKIWECNRLC